MSGSPRSLPRLIAIRARHLRSPESGVLGQGVRFVISGGTVAVVYVAVTTVLVHLVGMPFQLALAIGFTTALVTHFLFQRYFVWVHRERFSLSARGQILRYGAIAATQYVTTAAAIAFLPPALNVSTTLVYLVWTAVVSVGNFILFGRGVFHPRKRPAGPEI